MTHGVVFLPNGTAMKTLRLLVPILCAALILCGCAAKRQVYDSVNIEQRDTVRVETVTIYVPDTVFIEIPAQTAERETRDSVSRLENDYASSEARINSDGSLYHDLKTKPQKKPVEFSKPVERRDSIVYRERVKTKTVTKTVEVPRQLTWLQKTSIYGFWSAIIVLMIVYTIKRIKAHILKIRKK